MQENHARFFQKTPAVTKVFCNFVETIEVI